MTIRELPQGLKDAVEIIEFVFATAKVVKDAKGDGGGINFADLPKVFTLIDPADRAFDGYEGVPAAWKLATDEQKEVVYDYFVEQFDLPNDVVEGKIEKAVRAGYLLLDIIID